MALPARYVIATMRYGVAHRPLQMNILWFTVTGVSSEPTDAETAAAFATSLAATYNDFIAAVTTTETDLIGIHLQYHNTGLVWEASTPFLTTNGVVAEDTLPEFVAVCIQKRSSHAGRSGRGRWFIGCAADTAFDNGSLDPGFLPSYDALATVLMEPQIIAGCTLTPQIHSAKDSALYPMVAFHTDDQAATQRRRRVRPLL